MKRYSFTLSLLLLILLVFPFLWIQEAFQRESFDDAPLEWQTIEGDASALDSLVFNGYLHSLNPYDPQSTWDSAPFQYKGEDTHPEATLSILTRFDETSSDRLNRYIKNHRSFMRGKTHDSQFFTETEEEIIYAATDSDHSFTHPEEPILHVSVLDKETEEIEELSVQMTNLEQESSLSYYQVKNIAVNYPMVHVFVSAMENGQRGDQEHLFIYPIDMTEQEDNAPFDNDIHLNAQTSGEWIQSNADLSTANSHILLRTAEVTSESNLNPADFLLYDMETQNIQSLDLPDEVHRPYVVMDHEDVYLIDNQGSTLEVFLYDVESDGLQEVTSIELALSPSFDNHLNVHYSNDYLQPILVHNGFLYVYDLPVDQSSSSLDLQVSDLTTGDLVSHGQFGIQDTDYPPADMFIEAVYFEEITN